MPTSRNDVLKESAFETAADWSVSHGRRFRANIIIRGMRKHYSTSPTSQPAVLLVLILSPWWLHR